LKLFSQFSDYPVESTTLPTPNPTPNPNPTPQQQLTAADLLARAAQDFADADAALKNGDLATYQTKIKDAQQNVAQAQQLLGGTSPGGASTTTTTTSTTSTTAPTSTTSGASALGPPPPSAH
jgi:hypothetical protein